MAKVKGLDVIAVTDHNSALNLPQAMAAGGAYGVQVIPGLEVASKEDVHMLAYFETLEAALAFGEVVHAHLPDIQNNPQLFGRQLVVGEDDQIVSEYERLLIAATDFSLSDLEKEIRKHGGCAIPAHINRTSNGMIGALGLMPPLPQYPVVEVSPGIACPEYATKGRVILHSSDAHALECIQERVFALEAEEGTAQAVVARLKNEGA